MYRFSSTSHFWPSWMDEEVRRDGRSAVLRRAIRDYLKRRRRQAIERQYREAYADGQGLGDEFEGWEKQGEWPPE